MTELLKNFEDTKSKCKELEKQNSQLREEIKIMKRQSRKNNFLIYNVAKEDNENTVGKVKQICADIEVALPDSAINDCFRVGKREPQPILVTLNNQFIKRDIFKKKQLLQEKNMRISHDRSKEDREEGRRVYNYLIKLKSLDPNISYRRNLFKFRGSFLTLKEIEDLLDNFTETDETTESETNSERTKKKVKIDKRTRTKLESFMFRQRSSPVPSSADI